MGAKYVQLIGVDQSERCFSTSIPSSFGSLPPPSQRKMWTINVASERDVLAPTLGNKDKDTGQVVTLSSSRTYVLQHQYEGDD